MRIGETIATYDIGLALRGKSGKFEVTVVAGEIYDVTRRSGHSVSSPAVSNLAFSNMEWSSAETENPPFLIRRVPDGAPLNGKHATTSALEENATAPPLPFVLEHAGDGEHAPSVGSVELLYREDDAASGPPSACVYLKSAQAETWMTSQCSTFNELDSQIRKIEAQLDDIRSRAKKMFYKSHATARTA